MNQSGILTTNKVAWLEKLAMTEQVWQRLVRRLLRCLTARYEETRVCSIVAFLLTLLFACLITLIAPLIPSSPLNSLTFIFTFGALLIFVPLRARLNSILGRVLYPERRVYRKIVEEYGQIMRETSDLAELLQYVTQTLYNNLDTESVSVWLYHAEDQNLILARSEGMLTVDDLTTLPVDLGLKQLPGTQPVSALPEGTLRQRLLALDVQAITSMSLRDDLVGLIGLGRHRFNPQYSPETLRLLDWLAGQSALAVKNACLITTLEETLRKLQLAYRQTITAQEEERRSLAAELHDDILGRLTTLTMTLRNSRNYLAIDPDQVQGWLEALEQETQSVNRRLREITQGLHPAVLTDFGLISALQAYIQSLAIRLVSPSAPKMIILTAQGFNKERIADQALERNLYHVTRQALDNALTHAQAEQIFIHLHWHEDTISVVIQDTGCGMRDKPHVLMGQNGHLGLLSMNERVRAWQGHLTFNTAPGRGTTVCARFPIDQPSSAPAYGQTFIQHLVRPGLAATPPG